MEGKCTASLGRQGIRTDIREENTFESTLSSHALRLREARLSANLTVKRLAAMAGVDEATICGWETGRRPTLSTARKVARALDLDVAYLLATDSVPAESLPERIRLARLQKGLSQREMAAQFGVDESTWLAWERGRHRPSPRMMRSLLALLGTTEAAAPVSREPTHGQPPFTRRPGPP